MMGVGAGDGGNIHCTDMDVIEKSNLNRQFLFRPEDVGSLKSDTAGKRAKDMNPSLNIQTYSTKMGMYMLDVYVYTYICICTCTCMCMCMCRYM
jgi:ubiquitin-activating enzyme E1